MTERTDQRDAIAHALAALCATPTSDAARAFFAALGYSGTRTFPLSGLSDFLETFDPDGELRARRKAFLDEWRSIDLLFQLTDDDLSGEGTLFTETRVDKGLMRSYLFFHIVLKGDSYPRSKLAQITRQVNSLFTMPIMVLFSYGSTLSIAVINRRRNKIDASKDVLGKVTLIRDINCAAPHRGHLDILNSLAVRNLVHPQRLPISSFDALHAAWEKLFNVQLLNKSFYERLAGKFNNAGKLVKEGWYQKCLADIKIDLNAASRILNKDVDNELKPQAVIRVIIRLMFIWFMKEKGLLDARFFTREFAAEFVGKKDGYYNAILQNLFFAVLNKKINERRFRKEDLKNKYDPEKNDYGILDTFRHKMFFKPSKADVFLRETKAIPFVNGGLFACHDYKFSGKDAVTNERNTKNNYIIDGFSDNPKDRATISDDVMFDLLDLFSDYVFTIEESTPTEQDIALDPELLGTVFENLIGSYNPETKDNARKQTGSFYTPREIVEYMCKETLKESLSTRFPNLKTQIAELIDHHEDRLDFPKKAALIAAITELKILDPACGSGAFPMGMFLLMVRTIEKLQDHKTTYQNKLDIITNCIYGVDIQNIAIEISKLRFFISLLVDYPVPDNPEKFEVLPNLETKFAVANTLVGLDISQGDLFVSSLFDKCSELTSIFTPFTTARTPKEKTKIKNSFETKKEDLVELFKENHFATGEVEKIRAWNPFNVCYCSPFFDPAIMFGITGDSLDPNTPNGGFNIVIGNPPYVFARNSKSKGLTADSKAYFYSHYTLSEYQINLYPLFIEAGTRFLRPSGILSYITPNNWLTLNTNQKLRRFVLEKSNITIVNFYKRAFESADVDSAIVIFKNDKSAAKEESVRIAEWEDDYNVLGELPKSRFLSNEDCVINIEAVKGGEVFGLLEKIEETSAPLAEIATVKAGLKAYETGAGNPPQSEDIKKQRAFHSHKGGKDCIKYLEGRDVCRYSLNWSGEFLKYGNHLAAPRGNFDIFSTPRILVRQIPSPLPYCINACYTEETLLNDLNSMNVIYIRIPPKCLLAALNSRVVSWWFAHKFGKLQRGIFPQFKVNELAQFPIPKTFEPHEESLTGLVDTLLAAKRLNETIVAEFLDNVIDACVMELYFREHMAERNLLFFDKIAPLLTDFSPDDKDDAQRAFLTKLHKNLNAPDAKVRNQLLRLAADSPDLLGIIING